MGSEGDVQISFGIFSGQIVARNGLKSLAVIQSHSTELRAANTRSVLEQFVEYRIEVAGRTADDAQHLRCRGLLLQQFSEVACSCLQILEQPDIFDRDNRLVGKSGDQLDLLLVERLWLGLGDKNHADDLAVT